MRDAWRLALGMLTVVRVAAPTTVDRDVARRAMLLAPLAVLPLAAAVALVTALAAWGGLPPLAVGLLGVATLVLGTRAFHVDGLSDTADGLTASYDTERSLAVMRSGTSGPAGGVAVLLVLGLQVVGIAALAHDLAGSVLVGLLVCVSRCALLLSCARGVPGARTDGLGGTYVGTVARPVAAGGWVVAAVPVCLAVAWAGGEWWLGALACVLAVVVVLALVHRTVRRFGGVTGDVFGAAIELALATLLVAVLVAP